MPIDFFQESCKTESNNNKFGLCDDPSQSEEPAYIEEREQSSEQSNVWIAIVKNPEQRNCKFYAIDHCVEILKSDGKEEKRCDGLLSYANNLIFIELKSGTNRKRLTKGHKQLTTTVQRFKSENDITQYNDVKAFVCNNLRPFANKGQASTIQKFKDDTGLILKTEQTINLN